MKTQNNNNIKNNNNIYNKNNSNKITNLDMTV